MTACLFTELLYTLFYKLVIHRFLDYISNLFTTGE